MKKKIKLKIFQIKVPNEEKKKNIISKIKKMEKRKKKKLYHQDNALMRFSI